VEPIGEDHAVPPIAAEQATIEALRPAQPGEAMRSAQPGEAMRSAQPEEQTVSTPASVAEPDIVSAEETKPEPVAAEEPVVREGDVVGTIAAQAVAIEGMRPAQAGEEVPIEPAAATEIPAATEIAAASPLIEPAAATVTSETIAESKVVEDAAPATAADSARAVAEIAPIAPDAAPIAAPTRVTPTRSVKPKIAAARPASPITSGGEVLSGGAAFAWSKHDQPKQSRAGVIAVAVVVILALAGGVGYYVWQQRIRFDATLGAPSQPILAASAPAPATSPAVSGAIPDPNAPLAASPATAGAQPAATGANSSSVIAPAATQASARNAQPIVNAQSSGAKPRPVSPPNATAQFAPGPEVAEMKMPAPAAAARSTNQTTPDITADVPSGVPSGSTGAFVSDAAQPDRPPPPQAVRTSSGVQQPRLLSAPPPIYPYGARSEHIEGDVSVDLLISETGKVASMTMISGPSLLRQAALDALRQRKYAPAMLDGKPTAAHIVVTIHFQL
jgi:protein TonB